MGPLDVLLAPVRVTRAVIRAADDLDAIAERARREPDSVEEVRERIDLLLRELILLNQRAGALNDVARSIVTGGEDLRQTGEDLTGTATVIESHLRVFRTSLPHIMRTLGIVEDLGDAVETVAETIEPLQTVTSGVGRVAKRLSSSD